MRSNVIAKLRAQQLSLHMAPSQLQLQHCCERLGPVQCALRGRSSWRTCAADQQEPPAVPALQCKGVGAVCLMA